ncbi:MAG: acetylornithine deacetylase, partial [Corynebacterium flavescens]|nr:acetylornithine deacetylase [Corynebacterium flavescens]
MNLYEETLELLQELIRNACVNDLTPDSGNEVRNADTLERFFADTP